VDFDTHVNQFAATGKIIADIFRSHKYFSERFEIKQQAGMMFW